MNREQMIAWLTLEGVELYTAPIDGDKHGRSAWESRDGDDVLQRYMHKPDSWERYHVYPRYPNRAPSGLTRLKPNELRELYEDILERHK